MKKELIRNIGVVFIIVILCLGVTQIYEGLDQNPRAYGEDLAQYGIHDYKIDAQFSEEDNLLEVKQQVQYKNTHQIEFDTIYFHLYPNAFKEIEKVPFPEEEMDIAYPQGFETGFIDMKEVRVKDQEVEYELGGLQNTIMAIELEEELEPNEEITLTFEYKVKIPPVVSRFGYGENTYNLGNSYPIAAVYDERGWSLEPYHEIGDPFYSDMGNYDVTVRLPEKFEVATTGNIIRIDKEKNKVTKEKEKVWKIKAEGVRDFAWVISDDFIVKSEKVGETTIKAYYFKGQQGTKALEVAKDSIEIFNELFGKYPYEQFSVVSCDFYIGGMEYPNLVYIDQNVFSMDSTLILEYIIAHEAAHQWWYGMIGNDQVNEPWVDEALTEYSTILYFREKYGEETMMNMLKSMVIDDYVRTKASILGEEESIARAVDQFKDNREYSGLVYSKGAMMFYELERTVGRENFQNILRYYMEENKFSNVTGEEFIDITKAVTGKDYQEFFDEWL